MAGGSIELYEMLSSEQRLLLVLMPMLTKSPHLCFTCLEDTWALLEASPPTAVGSRSKGLSEINADSPTTKHTPLLADEASSKRASKWR